MVMAKKTRYVGLTPETNERLDLWFEAHPWLNQGYVFEVLVLQLLATSEEELTKLFVRYAMPAGAKEAAELDAAGRGGGERAETQPEGRKSKRG